MRRNPDVHLGSFMRQVEAEMTSRFGVGLSRVQQDVDPLEGPQMTAAAASGTTPGAFVDAFAAHYPLTPVRPGEQPAHRGRLNVGVMALATFARESDDWVQGSDGAAYRQDAEGVSRLVSSLDAKETGYGFRAEHAEGAVLGTDGMAPEGTAFVPLAGGPDFGIAVEALDRSLDARMSGPVMR